MSMQDYTIYCTPEQTRKALELGAPLNQVIEDFNAVPTYNAGKRKYYEISSAEQMICWLEEQGLFISIDKTTEKRVYYTILHQGNYRHKHNSYNSRKEATLAAIDAALDYLMSNKR